MEERSMSRCTRRKESREQDIDLGSMTRSRPAVGRCMFEEAAGSESGSLGTDSVEERRRPFQ